MTLHGHVVAAGQPQADAVVVAFAPGTDRALATACTAADGSFGLDVDGEVELLAKLRGDVLGLVLATAIPGAPAVLDVPAPVHPLTVCAAGDLPPGGGLDVQFGVREPAGSDARATALFYVPVGDGTDIVLARRALGPDPVRVRAQAGRWALFAALEVGTDARSATNPPRRWTVARAVAEPGGELATGRAGHELDLDGPTTVTLHIRERAI